MAAANACWRPRPPGSAILPGSKAGQSRPTASARRPRSRFRSPWPRRSRRGRDAGRQVWLGLVYPVPDRLFRLCQRLCDADHHVPAVCRHRETAVRRARPTARLAKGVHLMAASVTALRPTNRRYRSVDIDIRGVSHHFDLAGAKLPVLHGIDLSVAAGEFVALLGPSGCGKSTLLRLVAGLERPSAGTITADGRPIDRPDPSRILVFQDPTLFPWATVWANVATGP